MENSKKFQEIASGLQSVVFAISVLFAGWWALFIFLDNKNTSLELSLKVESKNDENNMPYAAVELNIINSGNRLIEFNISDSKLRITKVSVEEARVTYGTPEIYDGAKFYPLLIQHQGAPFEERIPPNSKRKNIMLTKLLQPGIYTFEFYSRYGEDQYYWYTSTYAEIGSK